MLANMYDKNLSLINSSNIDIFVNPADKEKPYTILDSYLNLTWNTS